MTLFEKIKEYLGSKEKNFDEGLKLYTLASHQRSIMLYLQRKRDAVKLQYELGKLLKLMPDRLRKIILPDEEPKTPDTPILQNENTEGPQKTLETPVVQNNNTEGLQETEHKIVEFRKVNPEDLPEELKPLYDEISQAHKSMRSTHEKMKLAETDDERAELRKTLIQLDDFVKAGWETIDEYFLLQQQDKKEEKPVEKKEDDSSVNELGKSINAARSYISRGITDYGKAAEEKKPDLKKKILKRIDLLIENKIAVSKETKNSLVDLKIIAKNAKLLVE